MSNSSLEHINSWLAFAFTTVEAHDLILSEIWLSQDIYHDLTLSKKSRVKLNKFTKNFELWGALVYPLPLKFENKIRVTNNKFGRVIELEYNPSKSWKELYEDYDNFHLNHCPICRSLQRG